jgi:hypothetical protein
MDGCLGNEYSEFDKKSIRHFGEEKTTRSVVPVMHENPQVSFPTILLDNRERERERDRVKKQTGKGKKTEKKSNIQRKTTPPTPRIIVGHRFSQRDHTVGEAKNTHK